MDARHLDPQADAGVPLAAPLVAGLFVPNSGSGTQDSKVWEWV